MAQGGHIRHENYEFIDAKEPVPTPTLCHGLDLHPGDLDPTVLDGHALKTALEGYIPEFTYPEGPVPSLITGHGQDFHPGS
jgi:hypothetical protein